MKKLVYHVKLIFTTGGICFTVLIAHLVATRGVAVKNSLFQIEAPRVENGDGIQDGFCF